MAEHPPAQPDPQTPGVPEDILDLIVRYHDHDLDPAGLTKLRDALTQSAQAREVFARWTLHRHMLTEALSAHYSPEDDDAWQDPPNLLAELLRIEQQAQAALVEIHQPRKPWYANPWAIGFGSLAAMIAIAAVLAFALQGTGPAGPTSPTDLTTQQLETPTNQPAPVATLTRTHNATWAPAPAPGPAASAAREKARATHRNLTLTQGSPLHPNQRLTLTQGFAEITTNRGAIAILEAPATIELTENDNAIELLSGKLVGICETESSKGFLVRTEHTDITDLGTHFGVDATQTWATEVHVFDGKVAVGRLDAPVDTEPTLLLAGQSARATGINDAILSIDHDIDRFAAMLPATIPLPGTGQGLAAGEIDPRWTVIALDGQELDTSPPVRVFDEPETRGHGPRDAQWIGLKSNGEDSVIGQGQTIVLQTQVWIPSTADTDACTLQLRFIADYRLLSLVVNGQKVDIPPNRLHSKTSEMVVSEHLIHGANSIRFEIQDDTRPRGVNYVGLRASWELHTKNATPG